MKKGTLFLLLVFTTLVSVKAAKFTINNVGTTFSPAQVTININDTVIFVLASVHNAVEVSQATYDANGTTSNGGFSLPNGGGMVIFKNAGTFYFVCQPHASFGMKGIITVSGVTGINATTSINPSFLVYPNPTNDFLRLSYKLDTKAKVKIDLKNTSGANVVNLVSEVREPGLQDDYYPVSANIAPGVYFINLSIGSNLLIKKIVIQH